MESIFLEQREIVLALLNSIRDDINNLKEWNKDLTDINELLKSMGGMQDLAGNCLLIQTIGEDVKKIDKLTNGQLFSLRSEIPWKNVMSMRDRIAHGYHDIDTEVVWNIIKNDLDPLLDAINYLIEVAQLSDI